MLIKVLGIEVNTSVKKHALNMMTALAISKPGDTPITDPSKIHDRSLVS
jgi:hypothetical protein